VSKEIKSFGDLSDGQVAMLVLHFQDPESIKQENLPFWNDVEHLFNDENIDEFIEYAEERLVDWWTAE